MREPAPMSSGVTVEQVDPQPIAAVRFRASKADLAKVIPDACGKVRAFIRANNIAGAGRHVAVCLDGAINIECGVELAGAFISDGVVVASATPAGFVAHAAHVGPYQGLG